MKKNEYLSSLESVAIDAKKIEKIQKAYNVDLPEVIQKMITLANETLFFDDGTRVLSFEEIVDAEKDLHVAFKEKGIIPLVDCGENDFIVYHFGDRVWSKFNIVDETIFKKKNNLEELLK